MHQIKMLDQTLRGTVHLEEAISARCGCGILLENCDQCSERQKDNEKIFHRCSACNGMSRFKRNCFFSFLPIKHPFGQFGRSLIQFSCFSECHTLQ